MVSAQSNSVIVHHVRTTVRKAKASALPVNSTTVAHATMHHVLHATLMHLVRHVVTMTTSSPVPTRIWARKAA